MQQITNFLCTDHSAQQQKHVGVRKFLEGIKIFNLRPKMFSDAKKQVS